MGNLPKWNSPVVVPGAPGEVHIRLGFVALAALPRRPELGELFLVLEDSRQTSELLAEPEKPLPLHPKVRAFLGEEMSSS